jgi:hypothetical protein
MFPTARRHSSSKHLTGAKQVCSGGEQIKLMGESNKSWYNENPVVSRDYQGSKSSQVIAAVDEAKLKK